MFVKVTRDEAECKVKANAYPFIIFWFILSYIFILAYLCLMFYGLTGS